MALGRIKWWWKEEDSFGLITSDAGQDMFFHVSSLLPGHGVELVSGFRVEFDMKTAANGPMAYNVRNPDAPVEPKVSAPVHIEFLSAFEEEDKAVAYALHLLRAGQTVTLDGLQVSDQIKMKPEAEAIGQFEELIKNSLWIFDGSSLRWQFA